MICTTDTAATASAPTPRNMIAAGVKKSVGKKSAVRKNGLLNSMSNIGLSVSARKIGGDVRLSITLNWRHRRLPNVSRQKKLPCLTLSASHRRN